MLHSSCERGEWEWWENSPAGTQVRGGEGKRCSKQSSAPCSPGEYQAIPQQPMDTVQCRSPPTAMEEPEVGKEGCVSWHPWGPVWGSKRAAWQGTGSQLRSTPQRYTYENEGKATSVSSDTYRLPQLKESVLCRHKIYLVSFQKVLFKHFSKLITKIGALNRFKPLSNWIDM